MATSEITTRKFDIAVVGAGPGGYVAAIRAAQLGMSVAIIEKQHMGGVCLNWGCIPTKSLLKSAEVYQSMLHAEEYGLSTKDAGFDIKKIVQRSRDIAARLSRGIDFLMKKNDITVISGFGRLAAPGELEVSVDEELTGRVSATHIIFATGARPRSLPGMEADGEVIWSAKEAMVPESLPGSLLVVGSGAIGMEFASFYRTFGTEVTVLEMMDRILPQEDADVSAAAQRAFKKRGIKFFTDSKLETLEVKGSSAEAMWADRNGNSQGGTFDRVIMAVGVVANTEGLGLAEQGVKMERGQVVVDKWSETSVKGVYAIGDMTAPPWLAHKASHEAVICVEKIAGLENLEPLDPLSVPACTYSSPQIASVGLTEQQAKEQGINVRVGRFDLNALGKAQAMGEAEGFVKTIFDEDSGELLGAHMLGAEVTELIQGYVIAQKLEATEAELAHTVFAHPTMSEAMHESVLDAYDQAIHS
ncbi:dihydrolipoyl dehydrogenase [Biformimicrobium ophioploci]|uniref:Dihydrolipoyl dehydrogenase n=1 Tax=Biformimicrobium ophioploci TaxID=3036711 RepID=A0ABQ6M212_9GAMM|nr:dihydrolipoyl dehydrogenase [Microbulbifer sp. NKW57]GMG88391.1 dihydrolipoyl dehydrogenase [Microbulbifer sp. NKW57]